MISDSGKEANKDDIRSEADTEMSLTIASFIDLINEEDDLESLECFTTAMRNGGVPVFESSEWRFAMQSIADLLMHHSNDVVYVTRCLEIFRLYLNEEESDPIDIIQTGILQYLAKFLTNGTNYQCIELVLGVISVFDGVISASDKKCSPDGLDVPSSLLINALVYIRNQDQDFFASVVYSVIEITKNLLPLSNIDLVDLDGLYLTLKSLLSPNYRTSLPEIIECLHYLSLLDRKLLYSIDVYDIIKIANPNRPIEVVNFVLEISRETNDYSHIHSLVGYTVEGLGNMPNRSSFRALASIADCEAGIHAIAEFSLIDRPIFYSSEFTSQKDIIHIIAQLALINQFPQTQQGFSLYSNVLPSVCDADQDDVRHLILKLGENPDTKEVSEKMMDALGDQF